MMKHCPIICTWKAASKTTLENKNNADHKVCATRNLLSVINSASVKELLKHYWKLLPKTLQLTQIAET